MRTRRAFIILILAMLCILPSCRTENTNTVRFLVDNTVISTMEVPNGGYVAMPPTPEKENRIFRFWSSNGKDVFDFSQPIISDMDIIAVYTEVQIPKSLTIFENGELVGTGKITYEKDKVVYSEYGLNDGNPSRVLTTIHDGNIIVKHSEEHFNGVELVSSRTYENTYDGTQLISKITTIIEDSKTDIHKEEYTYMEDGRMSHMSFSMNGKPYREFTVEYIEEEGNRKEITSIRDLETGETQIITYYYRNNILTGQEITAPGFRQYSIVTFPDGNLDKQVQEIYVFNEELKKYELDRTAEFVNEYDEERCHLLSSTTTIQSSIGETTTSRYDWSPEVQDFLRLYPYAATSVSQQSGYEYESIDKHGNATRRQSRIVWEMVDTF